jgi:hypothetical protein
MVDREDGLKILEQELVDEFLEEGFQPVPDRLRFHDSPSDPFEIGQDRTQTLGELVGLVACLADGESRLALLAVRHFRRELLDRLEVEADLDLAPRFYPVLSSP